MEIIMLKNKLLSICCLGYNHADFLGENLDAIAAINYPNIEVIVVDDGSSDGSVEILNKISKNYPLPIKIIAQKNTGNIGKNFNTALSYASGEFVAFISLDDVFHAKIIKKEIDILINNSEIAFVASNNIQGINNDGFLTDSLPNLPTKNKNEVSFENLLEYEYHDFGGFYIQGTIFRTDLIKKIGGFDEDMTGDDIVLRTKLFRYLIEQNLIYKNQKNNFTWKCILLNDNNVFYRVHDNNIHKNTLRQIKIVTEYLGRYWSDRPNPEMLISWVEYYIRNNPEKIDNLFNLNNTTQTLKENSRIKETIRKQKDADLTFLEKIYRRRKLPDNFREIVIFNLFRIRYRLKNRIKKSKINTSTTHYTTLQ